MSQYPSDQGQPQPPYPQQPSYPQLPAQPPFYPPMQQPPKKKGFLRSPLGIGCGVLAALVILVIIIVVIASTASGGNSGTTSSNTSSTTANTPASSQSSQSNAIGKPVSAEDWTVTLNSATTSHGTDFDMPKAGNIFLIVNVTLKNTSSSNQDASSLGMFSLKDSTGQTYNQDIAYGKGPDGPVAAGGLIRGVIAYEVPKSVHSFTVQFVPHLGSSTLVEWTVKD